MLRAIWNGKLCINWSTWSKSLVVAITSREDSIVPKNLSIMDRQWIKRTETDPWTSTVIHSTWQCSSCIHSDIFIIHSTWHGRPPPRAAAGSEPSTRGVCPPQRPDRKSSFKSSNVLVVCAGLIFQRPRHSPFQKFLGTFASCMMPTARSKAGKVNSSIRFVKSFCRALQSRLVCFFLQAQSQSYLQNLICSFGSSVGEVSFRLSMLGSASTVFSIVSYLDIFQVKVFFLKPPATRSEKLLIDDTSTDSSSSPTIVFNRRTLVVILNIAQKWMTSLMVLLYLCSSLV